MESTRSSSINIVVIILAAAVVVVALFVCSKIHDYSPSKAAKVYNRPVTRKSGVKFNPHQVIDLVRLGTAPSCKTQSEKAKIVTAYIEVLVAFVLLIIHSLYCIYCLSA